MAEALPAISDLLSHTDIEITAHYAHPAVVPAWRRAWDHVVPMFAFPPAIRKLIYTTDEWRACTGRCARSSRLGAASRATRRRPSCCFWQSGMLACAGSDRLIGSPRWASLQSCSKIVFRPRLGPMPPPRSTPSYPPSTTHSKRGGCRHHGFRQVHHPLSRGASDRKLAHRGSRVHPRPHRPGVQGRPGPPRQAGRLAW